MSVKLDVNLYLKCIFI